MKIDRNGDEVSKQWKSSLAGRQRQETSPNPANTNNREKNTKKTPGTNPHKTGGKQILSKSRKKVSWKWESSVANRPSLSLFVYLDTYHLQSPTNCNVRSHTARA